MREGKAMALADGMSGSPYFGGPSRKSRLFRSQRPGEERVLGLPANEAEPSPEQGSGEPVPESDEGDTGSSVPADKVQVAARPRRTPGPRERYLHHPSIFERYRRQFFGAALLLTGALLGYFAGVAAGSAQVAKRPARVTPVLGLPKAASEEDQKQLDLAFQQEKQGYYKEARQNFTALSRKHPEWTSLAIELIRIDVYGQDYIAAQRSMNQIIQNGGPSRADALFLLGILDLKSRDFVDADTSFSQAADVDPARSDFYYFWGDSLRQQGRPQEAGVRLRSAKSRNQFETAEELLQIKIWLCDLQTDQEKSDQASAEIDTALAKLHPTAAALFGAAARSVKAERFAEAASFINRARSAMDSVVFNVVIHDPTFYQESWRSEMAPIYAREPAPAAQTKPVASTPAPAEEKPPASAGQATPLAATPAPVREKR